MIFPHLNSELISPILVREGRIGVRVGHTGLLLYTGKNYTRAACCVCFFIIYKEKKQNFMYLNTKIEHQVF